EGARGRGGAAQTVHRRPLGSAPMSRRRSLFIRSAATCALAIALLGACGGDKDDDGGKDGTASSTTTTSASTTTTTGSGTGGSTTTTAAGGSGSGSTPTSAPPAGDNGSTEGVIELTITGGNVEGGV